MKKTLLLISLLFIISCNKYMNPTNCLNTVEKTFPNSTIMSIPGEKYRFIVIQNNNTYYVETMKTFSNEITYTQKLKKYD